jgi:hypothetical protein
VENCLLDLFQRQPRGQGVGPDGPDEPDEPNENREGGGGGGGGGGSGGERERERERGREREEAPVAALEAHPRRGPTTRTHDADPRRGAYDVAEGASAVSWAVVRIVRGGPGR